MTPFYTGTGDSGMTGFLGKGRLSKDSVRIEAVGSVDEATAALGLARAMSEIEEVRQIVLKIQKKLYELMSELSADPDVAEQFDKINESDVEWVGKQIASLKNAVEMPRDFIVPGENPVGGAFSVARTVVRRAERRVIALLNTGGISKEILIAYLNRLSSLIFILEVFEYTHSGRGVRLAKEE